MRSTTKLSDMLIPDVMTVQDASIRLGYSQRHLRRLLRDGILPGRRLGRRWVILRGPLLAALAPDNAPGQSGGQMVRLKGGAS